jgi:hypothetical protein
VVTNPNPRTLSQRTIAPRLAAAIEQRDLDALTRVGAEAVAELERLTRTPPIEGDPDPDLYELLLDLDHPVAAAAADELGRLRQIIRSVFFDCETHTIPRVRGVRVIVNERLFDAIRTEARRP